MITVTQAKNFSLKESNGDSDDKKVRMKWIAILISLATRCCQMHFQMC